MTTESTEGTKYAKYVHMDGIQQAPFTPPMACDVVQAGYDKAGHRVYNGGTFLLIMPIYRLPIDAQALFSAPI